MMRFKLFFPDGLAPEESECSASQLSERWLRTCSGVFEQVGAVFTHNMGATLSHFDVQMAGPTGKLFAYGRPCFSFAVSSGTLSEQDRGTLRHFADLHRAACSLAGVTPAAAAVRAIEESSTMPSILLFDHMDAALPEDQKGALMQLGQHFGAAFLRYVSNGQKG